MEPRFLFKGLMIFSVGVLAAFCGCMSQPEANIWSECRNGSAYVFIGAGEDLKGVKCAALDKEFFGDAEVIIGDLSKNDEDVCRFALKKDTSQPLRFEVSFNGKVQREVCDWQNYQSYVD